MEDVATWLLAYVQAEIAGRRRVYQQSVVRKLKAEFGDEWVYRNPQGNLAIDKRVLRAWVKLPGWNEGFKWDRSNQSWAAVKPAG